MIKNLTISIFIIFWLLLVLTFITVLVLPQLTSNQLNHLIDIQIHQKMMKDKKIQDGLIIDQSNNLTWWQKLLHTINLWLIPNPQIIIVTNAEYIIKDSLQDMQNVRTFTITPDSIEIKKKNKYNLFKILRPCLPKNKKDKDNLYLVHYNNNFKARLVYLILNRPFLLVLIMIFISTPLLIWLIWILNISIYKFKNTTNNINKITHLIQHSKLEYKSQELLFNGIDLRQVVIKLQNMVNAQKRLISNISHELRTPLTRLQLAIALMRRRQKEYDALSRIEMEAHRLDNMINDLLTLSYNLHKTTLEYEYLEIDKLWCDVLKNAIFEAEQIGKILEIINLSGPWTVLGSYTALYSAFENIVRNAIHYSHHKIKVNFSYDSKGIIIRVDDDGFGVAQEELEEIFKPFYRTHEARNNNFKSTGLGLSIVKTVIEQYNGWVKAEESLLGGLCVKVWLPLYMR